ncbi:uncharacterized protein LOC128387112 [Panonychus citri]|uniref:uncharacterized protein LOC128387112 n=1 Tax=Panonychus citri TaxID=50023 RepID=UPI002307F866|nr:uncharacterized protein LOC128387112 [Panonychus citri]
MQLNDLPEDCLSNIFDWIPCIKQLLSFSTVCSGWNNLVKRRLKKVRNLHLYKCNLSCSNQAEFFNLWKYSPYNHIYTNDIGLLERVNVSKLLPNLKYFTTEFYGNQQCMCKATINVLSTSNTLIGLLGRSPCINSKVTNCSNRVHIDDIVRHCGNLEYLSSESKPFIRSFFFSFGDNLKHFEASVDLSKFSLYHGATDSFTRLLAKMPNLETLSLSDEPEIEPPKWPKPKMNLKQLEILNIPVDVSTLQVLSFFPELPSLYLSFCISEDKDETFPFFGVHPNVQDLALEIYLIVRDDDIEYINLIKSVLVKFPNCANLMIRLHSECISNESVFKIIEMLPNLNLFVLHVEQILGDWCYPDYFNTVDTHCRSIGRRIAFYLVNDDFGEISRYSLNEDIANPFNTDNQFIHKYFRRGLCRYQSSY